MNPSPYLAARRAAALLPPAMSMYGPPAVAGAGSRGSAGRRGRRGSPSAAAAASRATRRPPCPARRMSTPKCSYSSARWPIPKAYETRPLLMMSRTLISSASRTGSQNGDGHGGQQDRQLLGAGGDRRRQNVRNRQVPVVGAVMLGQHGDHRAARLCPRTHVDGRGVQIGRGRSASGARMSNRRVNISAASRTGWSRRPTLT